MKGPEMETWNNRKIPFTIQNEPEIDIFRWYSIPIDPHDRWANKSPNQLDGRIKMEFDIKELHPVTNAGDKADIRINDKQAVYQFDGKNWILMEIWALVDVDHLDPKYIIRPDEPRDEPLHKHYLTGTGS